MSTRALDFVEPFFSVKYLLGEKEYPIGKKSIVFNLAQQPIKIRQQGLGFFKSTLVTNFTIEDIERCLVIEDLERHEDPEALFAKIKGKWALVYEATKLERHKGVMLWRSPKIRLGNIEVNMCFAEGIPLNVGLHRTHWGDTPFREVHTQILGFGKMQHYREQDLGTLFREDPMSPGCTHEPMYDENCIYPWHQYETVTKAIFMATEMQL
ncbi:MAG: hypothetical protein NT061_03055 [Spirochaetes bacterium]|nr:hypothetical protein [Spirochaetota bacterium]